MDVFGHIDTQLTKNIKVSLESRSIHDAISRRHQVPVSKLRRMYHGVLGHPAPMRTVLIIVIFDT